MSLYPFVCILVEATIDGFLKIDRKLKSNVENRAQVCVKKSPIKTHESLQIPNEKKWIGWQFAMKRIAMKIPGRRSTGRCLEGEENSEIFLRCVNNRRESVWKKIRASDVEIRYWWTTVWQRRPSPESANKWLPSSNCCWLKGTACNRSTDGGRRKKFWNRTES